MRSQESLFLVLNLVAGAGAIVSPASRLAALPHDGKALAASFGVLGGFDKVVQLLAARRVLSRPAARKVMHVGAGPLFLCCWPWFSDAPRARYWAAIGPLALTLKAFAAGAGLVDDPKTVASMSRSGDRRELLRGPTLYGAVFVGARRDRVRRHFNVSWIRPSSGFLRNSRRTPARAENGPANVSADMRRTVPRESPPKWPEPTSF